MRVREEILDRSKKKKCFRLFYLEPRQCHRRRCGHRHHTKSLVRVLQQVLQLGNPGPSIPNGLKLRADRPQRQGMENKICPECVDEHNADLAHGAGAPGRGGVGVRGARECMISCKIQRSERKLENRKKL